MNNQQPEPPKQPKQPLVARLGFFVLGGVLSSGLNWCILKVAMRFFGLSYAYGYAASAAGTAVILFLWSYYINFRTSRVWKNCLGRYLVCWAAALLVNYLIGVSGLKHFGSSGLLQYLVIVVVQSFTGGVKFLLYHFWVFPHADGGVEAQSEGGKGLKGLKGQKGPMAADLRENDRVARGATGPFGSVRKVFRRLSDLPGWGEALVWVFIVAVTVGMRLYLIHLLPIGLWSKDAGSYAWAAFRWIHTGVWETDPRRGPIYSMLIALCGKLWGSIDSLMVLQHAMGVAAILLSIFALRLLHGRRALIPLAACGYAYAVYGLPLYMEHLVRNETILFFCGSVSLVTWLFAIRWRQPHWLWITGFAAAVLTATKNVWLPFPLVFAAGTLWYFRKEMRLAVTQVLIFAVAFGVPYMGAKIFKHRTLGVDRSDEPQDGVLLYGRTAQFTRLDGGIEPELKKQIRSEVEAYRHEVFGDGSRPPRLNNNEILKHTVVPTLSKILRSEGKTGDDLNALCRNLAVEGIRTHPLLYGEQVWRDMARMHLISGARYVAPDNSEPESQRSLLLELTAPDPIIHVPEALAKLDEIAGKPMDAGGKKVKRHAMKGRFDTYRMVLLSAWLFDFAPVLWTSLLLPVVFFLSPVPTRAWWLGSAGLWYFTVVLLSTVGRPLDRYLIPALPIMFFTLSSAVIRAWNAISGPPSAEG